MAGINRLGKAPPRPGSLRPPDPNRNRIMNMYSEGAENDTDYQRMVQDIEDAQQSQVGWLFGRGAFDKADLLYLRDEEEKRRFKEEELRDRERLAFRKQRATAVEPLGGGAAPLAAGSKRGAERSQSSILASLVKVKGERQAGAGAGGRAGAGQPHDRGAPGQAEPAAKRQRGGVKEEAGVKPEAGVKEEEAGEEAGLAGMLGAYGSDSEEDEAAGAGVKAPPPAVKEEDVT